MRKLCLAEWFAAEDLDQQAPAGLEFEVDDKIWETCTYITYIYTHMYTSCFFLKILGASYIQSGCSETLLRCRLEVEFGLFWVL